MKNKLIEQFVYYFRKDINNPIFLKEHKLEGFIYYCYYKNNFNLIEKPQDFIKERFIENKKRNAILKNEYCRLKEICDSMDISILLVRGLYLINTIYESYGQRSMSDVDIIYNYSNRYAINTYLLSNGYYQNDLDNINLYKKDINEKGIVFTCKFDFFECDKLPPALHQKSILVELYMLLKSLYESTNMKTRLEYGIDCTLIKLIDLLLFLLHFKHQLNKSFIMEFFNLNYKYYDSADNFMLKVFNKSIKEIVFDEKI